MNIERRTGNITPREIERVEIPIALNELVHKVPVDKDHVQTLSRSIEQSGQLSPLLVWTRDNQIIDGFHRLEALRQLGASSAVCNLIEFNQEEFRDARITSAVTHKGVSFARVVTWTREVFDDTPWALKIRSAEAFHLEKAVQYPKGFRRTIKSGFTTEELEELLKWTRQKSAIWGLKSEQIANMLDLADITAPVLIPLVRERHHPREDVLTRPMLRRIVNQVPDHQAQEALVNKATAEKLNEAEVKRLVMSYANAQTQQQIETVFSTSWLDVTKPAPTPFVKSEDAKNAEEESRISVERMRIEITRGVILDFASNLPDLPVSNHPDLKCALDDAIIQLLIGVAKYQGEKVDIVIKLQSQIEQLSEENLNLKSENTLLNRNLTSLRNSLGIARRISDEEHQLRKDS